MPKQPAKEEPKPAEDLAVTLEVQSQQQASLDHQKEVEQGQKDIVDAGPPVEQPVTVTVLAPADGINNPIQPASLEAFPSRDLEGRPILEQARNAPPLCCPECLKGPFESQRALDAHVRFKHTLPASRAKAAAEKKKLEEAGRAAINGEPIPAPDFSDIGGPAAPPPIQPLVNPSQRYEVLAGQTFDLSTGLLSKVFGPEWQPSDADERKAVVYAIHKYYESVQLPDLPPGYLLCFVCLAYAAPRLGAQPTKTKLQRAFLWLKSKFSRQKPHSIPVILATPKE